MDLPSLAFVGLNVLFAVLFAIGARAVLGRRGSPMLWAYVLVTLLLFYLLPVQDYSLDVGEVVLVVSHLLLLLYLLAVLLVARAQSVRLDELSWRVHAVPNRVFFVVIVGWLAVRAYLIAMYGPAGVNFSRLGAFELYGRVVFSSWEVALSSITTMALIGVLGAVVIRHAAGGRNHSAFSMAVALLMLVLIIVTNESPIGSRRLLLVLGALWLTVAWTRSGLSVRAWVRRHSARLALMLVLVAALAVYYQSIRSNDMTEILIARDPGELVVATVKFAATLAGEQDRDEVHHLRSGPFDFFSKVVYVWLVEGRGSKGDATALSFAMAVPRALYPGEKPVGDVDDILFEHLGIYPSRPSLNVDYPTSLPAIGVADLGPLGVLPVAIVLGLAFVGVGCAMRRFGRNWFAFLIAFGFGVQLIGSQESGLTAILSAFRDAVVALLLIVPIGSVWRRCIGPGFLDRTAP
jgi:hypothetical protein